MGATEDQRKCIEDTFGIPAAVVAGAGSGKTDTLTRRVVYALQNPEKSGVTQIEQILAITYTNAAAAELKARIKSALDEAASSLNNLAEEALKVDGAWISTIHGMASRILKENAFAFGIDPNFKVFSDDEVAFLLDCAMEKTLLNSDEFGAEIAALLQEYSRDDIKKTLEALVSLVRANGDEFLDNVVLPPKLDPVDVLCGLGEVFQEALRMVLEDFEERNAEKRGVKRQSEFIAEALVALEQFHGRSFFDNPYQAASAQLEPSRQGEFALMTVPELVQVASAFCDISGFLDASKIFPEGFNMSTQQALRACAQSIAFAGVYDHLTALIVMAYQVANTFQGMKVAAGGLDNDDLLNLCSQKLKDPSFAAIAQTYTRQFQLVMVDEFQDTNADQVAMINLIAGGSYGQPSEKMCVVGDAQQSIYRFRNADLEVFKDYVSQVCNEETTVPMPIKLGMNFRSHNHILAFSKAIFTEVFQSDYLDLLHGRFGCAVEDADSGLYDRPETKIEDSEALEPMRINVSVLGKEGTKNVSATAAAVIARDFRALANRGVPAGDMAVLLGSMTHAAKYAKALREVGLPCAITGGSIFKDTLEAQLVRSLVYALGNMRDEENLVAVLTSDLFCLSAEDLLALRYNSGGEEDGLHRAFQRAVKQGGAHTNSPLAPHVQLAVKVLADAASKVGFCSMASIIEDVLVNSGWLSRVNEQAVDRGANAFKALRILSELEGDLIMGPMDLARKFDAWQQASKESPGVLSALGNNFVRIMTIHASKGLAFPVVAVAEADFNEKGGKGKLASIKMGSTTYLSLAPGESANLCSEGLFKYTAEVFSKEQEAFYGALKVLDCEPEQINAATPVSFAQAIKALNIFGDLEEHQRKLYVAFTRAREALVYVCNQPPKAERRVRPGSKDWVVDATEKLLLTSSDVQKEFAALKAKLKLEDVPLFQLTDFSPRVLDFFANYEDAPEYSVSWPLRFELIPFEGDVYWNGDVGEEGEGAKDLKDEETKDFWLQSESYLEPQASIDAEVNLGGYSARSASGVISASSIKREGKKQQSVEEITALEPESEAADGASAAHRGTAFHLLCQWSAASRENTSTSSFPTPPQERFLAAAKTYGLSQRQIDELSNAFKLWAQSSVAAKACSYSTALPEAPFWVQLSPGEALDADIAREPLVLEGLIDLLCYNAEGEGAAFVVDYKTGTFLNSDELRREAYELQAQVYAYAVLLQGYNEVTLDFVFVDQPSAEEPGQPTVLTFPGPQEAPYTIDFLREAILNALCKKS